MNTPDIESMAREAGFAVSNVGAWIEFRTPLDRICSVELTRFAALVRAAALELAMHEILEPVRAGCDRDTEVILRRAWDRVRLLSPL